MKSGLARVALPGIWGSKTTVYSWGQTQWKLLPALSHDCAGCCSHWNRQIWDNHSNHLLQGSLYEQYPHQAAFLPPGLNSHSGTFWFVCFSACCSTSGMSHCLFSWIKTMAHDQFKPDFSVGRLTVLFDLSLCCPEVSTWQGAGMWDPACVKSIFFSFWNLIYLIFNEATVPLLSHSFSCLQSLPCFIFPTAPPISHSLLSQRLSGMFHKQGWGYISMSLTVDWNYVSYSCWLL